jgi:hypothetical protein
MNLLSDDSVSEVMAPPNPDGAQQVWRSPMISRGVIPMNGRVFE